MLYYAVKDSPRYFPSPALARLLTPFWQPEAGPVCEYSGSPDRWEYSFTGSLEFVRESDVALTPDQHAAFGLLCAFPWVESKAFRQWALDYLRGNRREVDFDPGSPTGHAATGVYLDPAVGGACAGHRAYLDHKADLQQAADIAIALPGEQIAQFLES